MTTRFWQSVASFATRGPLPRLLSLLGTSVILAATAQATPAIGIDAGPAPVLRVCLDPDNLPFSSGHPGDAGLYTEYSQQIAAKLGRPFEPVWSQSYFGKFIVRTTLLAHKCDAFIGLPDDVGFMGKKLVFSKPFIHVGFVLATKPDQTVTSLDDLKGKTVAVQFGTPAQIMLADHDDIKMMTFLSPEEAMAALADGRAAAAFVWGPSAGYAAKKTGQPVRFVTIPGDGMAWTVGIGFAKTNSALRDQVNQAIDGLGGTLDTLKAKYGMPEAAATPTVQPVAAAMAAVTPAVVVPAVAVAAAPVAAPVAPAAVPAQVGQTGATPTQIAYAPVLFKPVTDAAGIEEGHKIFNGTCSHCHGPNAVQAIHRIDLRLLHHRYGDKMDETFSYTVTHGRPTKGMPNWTGAFTYEQFDQILGYLHSVQNMAE